MRVYVESNFLLELTLAQKQYQSCEDILDLCKRNRMPLVMPAFCIPEAHHALAGKWKRRSTLARDFVIEVEQLLRSDLFQSSEADLRSVKGLLGSSSDHEGRQFEKCLDRVMSVAEIIPLDAEILRSALAIRTGAALKFPDSVVLASVLADLNRHEQTESCFLNRDTDFNESIDTLERRGCKILFSFDEGLEYLARKSA